MYKKDRLTRFKGRRGSIGIRPSNIVSYSTEFDEDSKKYFLAVKVVGGDTYDFLIEERERLEDLVFAEYENEEEEA